MNVILQFLKRRSITSLQTVDHAHQMNHLHLKTVDKLCRLCVFMSLSCVNAIHSQTQYTPVIKSTPTLCRLYESLVCQRDTLLDTVYTSHKVYPSHKAYSNPSSKPTVAPFSLPLFIVEYSDDKHNFICAIHHATPPPPPPPPPTHTHTPSPFTNRFYVKLNGMFSTHNNFCAAFTHRCVPPGSSLGHAERCPQQGLLNLQCSQVVLAN